MANTGVLPFVRGIDFTNNDFSGDLFPANAGDMTGLRWMKLNRTNLEKVPEELSNLTNLEHLQMVGNKLTSVHGELSDLPNLRSIIVRHNQIKTSGIPTDIFQMADLTILDFSNNSLKEVPPNLELATRTIVLNLSHNVITSIPNQVFVNMIDLLHLDLSHNKLDMLPPQIRRLTELQVLILSENPLQHFQLKQLPSMTSLRVLSMRNTQRNINNVPSTLDNLVNLEDVDFSCNQLDEVPDCLFKLPALRKLNLSDNNLSDIKPFCDCWENLESLNLSLNQLAVLPDFIVKMTKLRKLYLNHNKLTFEGIPAGIGKLVQLEVFHAAYNKLELVPEGLSRCVKLIRIKLNNNKLITMPQSIQILPDLKELDVRNNRELVMPPKPSEMKRKAQYYNIDFSLENQMKMAGATTACSSLSSSPAPTSGSGSRDPVAKKIQFMRRRKQLAEADSDQQRILQGFEDIAKKKEEQINAQTEVGGLRPKRWDEALTKQTPKNMDYSEIFDVDRVGQAPGLEVWEIENFLPNPLDSAFHGHFYEEDCYIICKTSIKDDMSKTYDIYYWIGEKTSLDKKACAAIHAVNLRNLLGATCRTVREEMCDESDEFMELFGDEISYVEGGRTTSGFFTIEKTEHPKRLFRIHPKGPQQIHLEPVECKADSLDSRYVFLLDIGAVMFVWCGRKSKGVLRSKTRLFAEKVNKNERKGDSEIEQVHQDSETAEFWDALEGEEMAPDDPIVEHVSEDFQPYSVKLYQVCLGMGYLELPQVEIPKGQLKQNLLQTKCVYILDTMTDVFLWIGKKSTRLVRAAGSKLAAEMHTIIYRPGFAGVNMVTEGTESMLFKSKFIGWDDIIAVDFTRTAESVQKRGSDLKVIMERDKMKTDLGALFLDRQETMNEDEAEQLMEECNEDLELMEPFVLEGKKFVKLPEHEFGIFYTMDCYVFLCRYWVPPEDDDEEDEAEGEGGPGTSKENGGNSNSETDEAEEDDVPKKKKKEKPPPQEDFQCVVYFWQGRDANNMGWLTFTFSLKKKFESLFKDKLEVVRMHQQQENQKFLSHFKKRFVIRRGRRGLSLFPSTRKWPELFHCRANGSPISTRTIQIDAKAVLLNSEFCYILKCPYPIADDNGIEGKILIWQGEKCSENEKRTALDVAQNLLNAEEYEMERIEENHEPDEFWDNLSGGKKAYEKNADFMKYSRLFRCTNEKGFFAISEKTIDFCQEDLDEDDVMILDNGDIVFIWIGSRASEVEVKLTKKAAQASPDRSHQQSHQTAHDSASPGHSFQAPPGHSHNPDHSQPHRHPTKVYIQHLRLKENERPRKLMATLKGKETKKFTKCFHAWGKHKVAAGD